MAIIRKRRSMRNWRKRAPRRKRQFGGRSLRQPVHYFKRAFFASSAITVTGGATTFGASEFDLATMPNFTEFTALYDQYKITAVKWQLLPRGNSAEIGLSSVQGLQGQVFTVLDYDDGNAPTSINQLTQYQNLKMTRNTVTHTRYLKPRFNMEVANVVATAANAPRTGWIDVANDQVRHRGVKYAIQAPTNATYVYDLMITYYMAFKNVR